MALPVFVRGLAVGFSIAAPVGPIGVLCIRRTLADGRAAGFVSGLGAATADATYGCIAGFGLTAIANLLVGQQFWISLIGGIFLCYLGVKTFISQPAEKAASARSAGLGGAYGSTLFLTLTNPATILSFIGVFAGLGIGGEKEYGAAARLVLGVFIGSALWWLILSGGVGLLRSRITSAHLQWVNRLSGAIIGGFGIAALARLALR